MALSSHPCTSTEGTAAMPEGANKPMSLRLWLLHEELKIRQQLRLLVPPHESYIIR